MKAVNWHSHKAAEGESRGALSQDEGTSADNHAVAALGRATAPHGSGIKSILRAPAPMLWSRRRRRLQRRPFTTVLPAEAQVVLRGSSFDAPGVWDEAVDAASGRPRPWRSLKRARRSHTRRPSPTYRCSRRDHVLLPGAEPRRSARLRSVPGWVLDQVLTSTVGEGGLGARTGTDRQCLICKEDCVAGDVVRWLPCMHVFHASSCIDVWFAHAATCPTCGRNVRDLLALPNPT